MITTGAMRLGWPSDLPGALRLLARCALYILLAYFAWRSQHMVVRLFHVQAAGADYSCFWAGMKALALGRPYDFTLVTSLQGWPFGPHGLRPYIYPPSAFFIFAPFAALPYWIGYGAWVAATYGLMAWAGRRMGAPWWMVLFPAIALVAFCGQVTFLIAGLVAAALTFRHRPILAGVLLGVAAAVKPQMLLFLPLALIADRQWRTLIAAGATGALMCAASAAIWGVDLWFAWLQALPRFQAEVILANPRLVEDGITPFSMLETRGLPGAWAYILAPFAVALVWVTFRNSERVADRLIAVFAAALIVSPYAMNYEAALLAPAIAAYMARTDDRLWPVYAAAGLVYTLGLVYGFWPVAAALALLLVTALRWAYARRITAKSARSCSAGRQLLEP